MPRLKCRNLMKRGLVWKASSQPYVLRSRAGELPLAGPNTRCCRVLPKVILVIPLAGPVELDVELQVVMPAPF